MAHVPAGDPVKTGVSTDGTKHWKEYADGTRIQEDPDGTTHYAYGKGAAHGIKQYSALTNGTSMVVYEDGRRVQKCANGTTLEVHPDGTKIQTNPDNTKIQNNKDGTTLQTNPNGVTMEILKDGMRIQKNPATGIEHHLYPDGRDIQVNPDGTKIEHLADGTTRQFNAAGETQKLKQVGTEVSDKDGTANVVFEVDTSEADAVAELRKKAADEAIAQEALAKDLVQAAENMDQQKMEISRQAEVLENDQDKKRAQKAVALEAKPSVPAPRAMTFIAMKKHLKTAGIDRSRVDNCLGKYELEKLAEECGVAFP